MLEPVSTPARRSARGGDGDCVRRSYGVTAARAPASSALARCSKRRNGSRGAAASPRAFPTWAAAPSN